MQSKDAAKLALQFLSRVELKGAEVPAFVEVSNWLTAVAAGEADAPTASDYAQHSYQNGNADAVLS